MAGNEFTVGGRSVSPLVITEDYVLTGGHQQPVVVEAGRFQLVGGLQGSLEIQTGASAVIAGGLQGSLHVSSGVAVLVTGSVQGSAHVEPGGELVVDPGAQLAGSLHNDGVVVIRGRFGGVQTGDGEFRVDGGTIIQPRIGSDGSYNFDM